MSIFKNFLIAQDQALNTLIRIEGEYGEPNETLSSRLWREGRHCVKRRKFVDALFFWEKEHCKNSFLAEFLRNAKYGRS